MSDGYDPQKSRVAEDALADFLRAPLTGDLTEVPGIGPAAVTKLADGEEGDRVENTFQLIGKFLMLKESAEKNEDGLIDCAAHCDAFWFWLKSKGINSYRSGVVMAIAEKVNTMLPGIYDAAEFHKMTRRAKERRLERTQEKARALDEKMAREIKLNARPEWKQLLAAIDGVPATLKWTHQPSPPKPATPAIVQELQWKSMHVPIAAASNFQLPIKLDGPRGTLLYSFSTREYDLDFGVQMICADGTMVELMENQRYESQKQQITGQLDVVGPGMILLIWDNSFSWLNTKQLAYSIELKQETLLSSEAKKVELARHARLTRERAVWNKENELDTVQTSIQTYEQTILDIKQQIEELQQHLQEKEETRMKIIQHREQVEDQIDTLCWEIQALNWRCLDANILAHIFSFQDKKDITALSMANKKWWQRVQNYHLSVQAEKESIPTQSNELP